MSRVALAAVAAAAVVLVPGLAAGWWQSSTSVPLPSQPVAATATLSRHTVGFGDPLTARLDIVVDPKRVDVSSVRLAPVFAPYRIVSSTETTKRSGGVLLSYRFGLECLDYACAPHTAELVKRFAPVTVTFRTRAGIAESAAVGWPAYQLYSRVSAADRNAPVDRLRYTAELPPPSYRIDPGTLRALLIALVAVLGLAAAGLGWLALRPPGRKRAGDTRSPLERALAAVRASTANGHVTERRKALGWLGRELGAVERGDLAHDAARLAWSAEAPTPESTGAFADGVEEEAR